MSTRDALGQQYGAHYVFVDGAPDGPWMGHLLDETGCVWLADTRSAVMEQAPEAISNFYGWLARHGEPEVRAVAPGSVQVELRDIQVIDGFGQSGAAVGLFEPDRQPANDALIATAVRRLGYARRDLLQAVTEMPIASLDWRPPHGKRTIRENLVHVRNVQGFYLTRVFGWDQAARILPEPWPEDLFRGLHWTLERSVEALLSLPESLRAGLFHAHEPREDWTARKMLRRFVEHEVEHLEVVRRTIRAWLGY